jgi:hypothetical protein
LTDGYVQYDTKRIGLLTKGKGGGRVDDGVFIGVFLALFLGGLSVAYGGYSLNNDHPLLAILSYVLGGALVAASVVLAFLRIDRSARQKRPSLAQGEVAQTL